ncbi:hypothetical protein BO94DRAFT_319388 [Aspergillus sclerotioniger CBS 115572]|uniref:Uncharacterized protein n=1 Tax=Aspergillus sclerotioniger CBS 115572 TaxID=1450535 RepID=A0A317X639_9EURO|nr:hypothetical protein BO94DRAFT_319388 [Aspergillus sclerotioniger CBS 115572]PWY94096.1 hypothetical protein BO94DRAFT_319388 [Aspergillus sclerotioniger CBS 115572]
MGGKRRWLRPCGGRSRPKLLFPAATLPRVTSPPCWSFPQPPGRFDSPTSDVFQSIAKRPDSERFALAPNWSVPQPLVSFCCSVKDEGVLRRRVGSGTEQVPALCSHSPFPWPNQKPPFLQKAPSGRPARKETHEIGRYSSSF